MGQWWCWPRSASYKGNFLCGNDVNKSCCREHPVRSTMAITAKISWFISFRYTSNFPCGGDDFTTSWFEPSPSCFMTSTLTPCKRLTQRSRQYNDVDPTTHNSLQFFWTKRFVQNWAWVSFRGLLLIMHYHYHYYYNAWFVVGKGISYYLNQRWPSYLKHMWVTRTNRITTVFLLNVLQSYLNTWTTVYQ